MKFKDWLNKTDNLYMLSDKTTLNYMEMVFSDWQKDVREKEAILRDFLTTKECRTTWIEEMTATIADVLSESSDEV